MSREKQQKAENVCTSVLAHPSTFYTSRIKPHTPFAKFPTISWSDLVQTPLAERLYTNEKLFVKCVSKTPDAANIGVTLSALRQESYGLEKTKRPWVAFTSRHEMYEKGFWCYEHNLLALMSGDTDTTERHASLYNADGFLGDMASTKNYMPSLHTLAIHTVVIFDEQFDMRFLREHNLRAHARLLFGFPETGIIGLSCPRRHTQDDLLFHESPHLYIDYESSTITTLLTLPTPLIKYRIPHTLKKRDAPCDCGEMVFTIV